MKKLLLAVILAFSVTSHAASQCPDLSGEFFCSNANIKSDSPFYSTNGEFGKINKVGWAYQISTLQENGVTKYIFSKRTEVIVDSKSSTDEGITQINSCVDGYFVSEYSFLDYMVHKT